MEQTKHYPFVVIEGYTLEDEPRRVTGCEDIRSACQYVLEVRKEIMEDYELVVDRPGEIGWYEGDKLRYCAIRKSEN